MQDCNHPFKRSKRPDFPKFGGNPLQWITFKETFLSWQSQCHNNDIGRFHALKESLERDALKKIETFHMTNKNYRGAWDLLVRTYENPMTLVSHHLNALLDLPKVNTQNYKEIERVADAAESHVASLKTLGVDVTEEVVTCILERTLSPELLNDWRKEVGAATQYPKYPTMISHLYRVVSYVSIGYRTTYLLNASLLLKCVHILLLISAEDHRNQYLVVHLVLSKCERV